MQTCCLGQVCESIDRTDGQEEDIPLSAQQIRGIAFALCTEYAGHASELARKRAIASRCIGDMGEYLGWLAVADDAHQIWSHMNQGESPGLRAALRDKVTLPNRSQPRRRQPPP